MKTSQYKTFLFINYYLLFLKLPSNIRGCYLKFQKKQVKIQLWSKKEDNEIYWFLSIVSLSLFAKSKVDFNEVEINFNIDQLIVGNDVLKK